MLTSSRRYVAPKTWLVCWSNNKYGIGQLKAPRMVSACLMMSTHAKILQQKVSMDLSENIPEWNR